MDKMQARKQRGRIILISAGAFLLLVIIFSVMKKNKTDYYVVKPVDVNYTILANCTVEYPDPLDIKASLEGDVQSIDAGEGSVVAQGQRLIQLDDFNERQNLSISSNTLISSQLKLKNVQDEELPKLKEKFDENKLNLEQAKNNLSRMKELEAAGGISKAELENAENSYKKAQAQYNQTKISLDNYSASGPIAELSKQIEINKSQYELAKKKVLDKRIMAPFDGTLLKIAVQKGQKVPAGAVLATVIEKKNWLLVLNVDQKELPYLKPGLMATIALDAMPDKKIKAEVVYVCTTIDVEKGTCELRLEVKDKTAAIKHGMTGSSEIFAEKFNKTLAVPSRFIKKKADGDYIWVWNGKKAELIKASVKQIGERWTILEEKHTGAVLLDAPVKAQASKLELGKEAKAL